MSEGTVRYPKRVSKLVQEAQQESAQYWLKRDVERLRSHEGAAAIAEAIREFELKQQQGEKCED